jgi:hypothetical protein
MEDHQRVQTAELNHSWSRTVGGARGQRHIRDLLSKSMCELIPGSHRRVLIEPA